MTRRFETTSPRRGSVLIVAMIVTMTLSATVLVLCRTVRVESMASANRAASMQADAIARGAEQYVLAVIATEGQNALSLSEDQFAAVPVGEGYFWLLRPNYDDDSLPVFGLVDEASKFDINYDDDISPQYSEEAHIQRLMLLPGMTEDVAAAIMDWQDGNQDPSSSGAEDEYYATLPEPYTAKNDRFESVEELLLVRGMTRQMRYGDGTAPPLGERTSVMRNGSFSTDAVLARGWADLFTCYTRERRRQPPRNNNETLRGLINPRWAPREVLLTITGLEEADVDKLIAARTGADTSNDRWIADALGPKYALVAPYVTSRTLQYSADILAVTANGRAFKRVKMVVDTSRSPTNPRVEYRRDITDRGWPMDPSVLASLRAGQGPGSAAIGMRSMGGAFR